ncbi:50S ribosomal protein L29 [Desulfomonile tiedjei]|uniref:Large ribosomal subunit protein uL29 n=1 Tax=Desulfomonile tiedjei (strain ATCC 49306 / DSM 6799 / DCB-1) TaxID=706587 RepID=I4CE69_DESTA|nr:50S ribosomal protein L29 [Desulfomonile tiedjei]AFM27860.1 LSU ribosomal protein L29P [Desulfomonile tiedjei DSM 6799]
MKPRELRDLSVEELAAKEKEFLNEEFQLRFKHATGQLDKTARLRKLRREIARVKTIIREKEASQ